MYCCIRPTAVISMIAVKPSFFAILKSNVGYL